MLWLVGLYLALLYAPDDRFLGATERILYIHLGAAWTAGVAFIVTTVLSILYLVRKDLKFDFWAASSAEVGTVLTTMVLVSGSIWGRVAWGTWWTWDPRLTATAVMWFMYVAYLLLRLNMDEVERRAKYSAVLGIIAFLDVPIVFLAIFWWRSIHPLLINNISANLPPKMLLATVVFFFAFIALYLDWMVLRVRQARVEYRVATIRDEQSAGL